MHKYACPISDLEWGVDEKNWNKTSKSWQRKSQVLKYTTECEIYHRRKPVGLCSNDNDDDDNDKNDYDDDDNDFA